MIVDACLFAGEQNMLTLRLLTIGPVIDRSVVVCCRRSHQGQPIDTDAISRAFESARVAAAEAGAIAHGHVSLHWVEPDTVIWRHNRVYERSPDERGGTNSIWFMAVEKQHRDGVRQAVVNVTEEVDAIVLVSDVDEIPNPTVVRSLAANPPKAGRSFVLEQRFHSTALDLLHPQQPWLGTIVSRFGDLAPQLQRDMRGQIGRRGVPMFPFPRGGWHLSWLGSDAERQRKLETFSHYELLRDGLWDPVEGRRTLTHPNGEPLRRITLGEAYALDWPLPLLDGSFVLPADWVTGDVWETS